LASKLSGFRTAAKKPHISYLLTLPVCSAFPYVYYRVTFFSFLEYIYFLNVVIVSILIYSESLICFEIPSKLLSGKHCVAKVSRKEMAAMYSGKSRLRVFCTGIS